MTVAGFIVCSVKRHTYLVPDGRAQSYSTLVARKLIVEKGGKGTVVRSSCSACIALILTAAFWFRSEMLEASRLLFV